MSAQSHRYWKHPYYFQCNESVIHDRTEQLLFLLAHLSQQQGKKIDENITITLNFYTDINVASQLREPIILPLMSRIRPPRP